VSLPKCAGTSRQNKLNSGRPLNGRRLSCRFSQARSELPETPCPSAHQLQHVPRPGLSSPQLLPGLLAADPWRPPGPRSNLPWRQHFPSAARRHPARCRLHCPARALPPVTGHLPGNSGGRHRTRPVPQRFGRRCVQHSGTAQSDGNRLHTGLCVCFKRGQVHICRKAGFDGCKLCLIRTARIHRRFQCRHRQGPRRGLPRCCIAHG
jgi:hypothetical protein